MKKNVFTKAMAVLASMTVLGAASMMSASAGDSNSIGITSTTVDSLDAETATVHINCDSVADDAYGFTVTVSWDSDLTLSGKPAAENGCNLAPGDVDGNSVLISGFGVADPLIGDVTALTFELPAGYADGDSWDVEIEVTNYGPAEDYTDTTTYNGTITVELPEPDPTDAPTEAPTAAPTAAPVATTVAAKTTVKKAASPKTGDGAAAVAVAGLVAAGATAVVLKKKH